MTAMTPAHTIQRGCGKGRNPWKIREFLSSIPSGNGRSVSMTTIAELAETYPQVAQETIRGTRNHKRVLRVLENLGCPVEYLYGTAPGPMARTA